MDHLVSRCEFVCKSGEMLVVDTYLDLLFIVKELHEMYMTTDVISFPDHDSTTVRYYLSLLRCYAERCSPCIDENEATNIDRVFFCSIDDISISQARGVFELCVRYTPRLVKLLYNDNIPTKLAMIFYQAYSGITLSFSYKGCSPYIEGNYHPFRFAFADIERHHSNIVREMLRSGEYVRTEKYRGKLETTHPSSHEAGELDFTTLLANNKGTTPIHPTSHWYDKSEVMFMYLISSGCSVDRMTGVKHGFYHDELQAIYSYNDLTNELVGYNKFTEYVDDDTVSHICYIFTRKLH